MQCKGAADRPMQLTYQPMCGEAHATLPLPVWRRVEWAMGE